MYNRVKEEDLILDLRNFGIELVFGIGFLKVDQHRCQSQISFFVWF